MLCAHVELKKYLSIGTATGNKKNSFITAIKTGTVNPLAVVSCVNFLVYI